MFVFSLLLYVNLVCQGKSSLVLKQVETGLFLIPKFVAEIFNFESEILILFLNFSRRCRCVFQPFEGSPKPVKVSQSDRLEQQNVKNEFDKNDVDKNDVSNDAEHWRRIVLSRTQQMYH